jgi:hypothetical protein
LDTCPKPNNLKAVFAEQRILASHFGIGSEKSGNSTAGEPVAPVSRSPAPAGDQVVVVVNG